MSKRKIQFGFTIVELLIIIVVIGILAALVRTTLTGVQQINRDKEREDDIKETHRLLEVYFSQQFRYPTLDNLNDKKWRESNMKDLKDDDLTDPKGKDAKLQKTPATSVYAYTPAANDGSECDNNAKDCVKYTLTATTEAGTTIVKNNIN